MKNFIRFAFLALTFSLLHSFTLKAQCDINPQITIENTPTGGKIYISVDENVEQVLVKLFDLRKDKVVTEKKLSLNNDSKKMIFENVSKGNYLIQININGCPSIVTGGISGFIIGAKL